jgi:hypothetical protein
MTMRLLGLALLLAVQNPDELAIHIYQDFRGKKYDEKLFRREGPEVAKRIKTEPAGLRITLPAEQQKPVAVGLVSTARIKGDFEISVGYQILMVGKARLAVPGVGFELYLMTDTPTKEAVAFFCIMNAEGEGKFALSRAATTKKGKREFQNAFFPAMEKTGTLRIARRGAEIVLSAVDGEGNEFQELQRLELGREDVKYLRLAANPGGFANALDLRVLDLRIRAQALEMPSKVQEAPARVHELPAARPQEPGPEPAQQLRADFRGRPVDERLFLYTGPNARRQMKEEPEGLRISLPAPDVQKQQPTGLVLNAPVAGDCRITAAYELLRLERPKEGYGAGVTLYVLTDTPTKEAVMLSHFSRILEGDVYSCARLSTNAAGKREIRTKYFAAKARAGKLRLTRKGPIVTFSIAEGEGDEFSELQQVEFGTEDLAMVRVAADTGNSATPVEGRLQSLAVQAESLPLLDIPAAAPRARWPLYIALASFSVLAFAGCLWIWWSRRMRQER